MQLRYDFDSVKIYQGDARRLDLIPDGSVHLIGTSPPYYNARDYSQWPTYETYLADMALVWAECHRVLCDGGRIAVNVPMGYGRHGSGGYICIGDDTTRALVAAGFTLRGHIIWYKAVANTGSLLGTAWGSWMSASDPCLRDDHEIIIVAHKGQASRGPGVSTIGRDDFLLATESVWKIAPISGQWNAWHPAPFPAEIPYRLIQLYTYEGDTVLDPFGGSMTTVWEAQKAGRQGIGVELSESYIQQACGGLLMLENEDEFRELGLQPLDKPALGE